MLSSENSILAATFTLAAVCSFVLTWALLPMLARYALARPNARSSHRVPTPQGGGIAVICATLAVAGVILASSGFGNATIPAAVFSATVFLAIVGAVDDLRPIPVGPRLLMQAFAVGTVLLTMSPELRVASWLPLWTEQTLLLLAALWFVNLVNFMDGLDWMTVVETVPVIAGLLFLGSMGHLTPIAMLIAAALGGATVGFAPFNRPVAKVFLGDVGSLPIGLLLGWCLCDLAQHGQIAAALLLPLYYLMDATVTLLIRLARRENVTNAHRSHFYQRATDNGFSVPAVVGRIMVLNIALVALAVMSASTQSALAKAGVLGAGMVIVAWTMRSLVSKRIA